MYSSCNKKGKRKKMLATVLFIVNKTNKQNNNRTLIRSSLYRNQSTFCLLTLASAFFDIKINPQKEKPYFGRMGRNCKKAACQRVPFCFGEISPCIESAKGVRRILKLLVGRRTCLVYFIRLDTEERINIS